MGEGTQFIVALKFNLGKWILQERMCYFRFKYWTSLNVSGVVSQKMLYTNQQKKGTEWVNTVVKY